MEPMDQQEEQSSCVHRRKLCEAVDSTDYGRVSNIAKAAYSCNVFLTKVCTYSCPIL